MHLVCSKYLVGSADQVQVMPPQELHYNVFPKCEGHATVILTPDRHQHANRTDIQA